MIRSRTILAYALILAAAAGLASATLSIARSNSAQAAAQDAATSPSATAPPPMIGALGTVEPPGGTIEIAPSIGGVVAAVMVSPAQDVSAGDVLFKLDDRLARARIAQLERSVTSAEAALAELSGTLPTLKAQADVAHAALEAALAQRDQSADDLAIAERLVGSSSSISQREVDSRRNALRSADAQVTQAEAQLRVAESERVQLDPDLGGSRLLPLQSAVEDARAALATAQTELALLTIASPTDARVLLVDVNPGEFAAAGNSASTVTLGATGLLQIRAEIEEADLPLLKDGAEAWAIVRGTDNERIALRFLRREPLLQPKATLSGSGNERIDTRVAEVLFEVTTAGAGLMPGQLVDVLVATDGP